MPTRAEELQAKVRDRFPSAKLEVDDLTLYIEIGEASYYATWDEGDQGYNFVQEAVGYQDAISYDRLSLQEVVEAIIPPPEPRAKAVRAKPAEPSELDVMERIARAALPSKWAEHPKWRDEGGYNNAGTPTRFFYIPGHNGDAKVEMLEEVSEHIVAFQPEAALKLIAAARVGQSVLERDPDRAGGKPVLKGTRFTVAQLLAELADGRDIKVIADDFDLPLDVCKAAVREIASGL